MARHELTPASGRATGGGASAEARLALVEFLLTCDDLPECAQRAVEWLGAHAGVRQAICAAVDTDPTRLVGVAGHGISPSRVRSFSLDLEDRDHPLVQALNGSRIVAFHGHLANGNGYGRHHPATPFGAAPFQAVPLCVRAVADEARAGLLLTSQVTGPAARDLRWLIDQLSQKLVRLRTLRMLTDVDRRLGRERALLHSIINAVSDPILLTDTEGRMIIANARAEMLFAASEGESEGRRRAVALNNMLFSSALSRRAIADTEASRRELLLVDPSEGSDLLFELLSTVVSDPREGTGIVSILRNVSDLRRATMEIEENYRKLRIAEADVRAERDRLDLIIDSVADPILVTDPSGNIVLMNTPAERLFTVSPEASSDEAQRVVRANDAHFSSFVSNLFFADTGLRWRGEISLVDPLTGVTMPVEAIAGKILSEHGEVTAVVTILHDRTEALEKARLYEQLERASRELEAKVREATAELVQQNELLQRQRIELEQASALKSQFLANMSHEFRTPLNAILGYTSMLLHGVSGELTAQQRKSMSRVDSNARHLLSIINDILDIARIEAGKMPLHLAEFPLSELISEVMAEVEPIIARSRLAVTSDIAPNLPVIRSDRQKVKQIVLNLLTNALKFTPQGSVRVSTAYTPAREEISVAVVDTGIGIAEADQEKVFEDFRQADNSPTREYGGTGLGLSICRRLATMLGGQITLSSKLGQGSTFTLVLPRRPRRR